MTVPNGTISFIEVWNLLRLSALTSPTCGRGAHTMHMQPPMRMCMHSMHASIEALCMACALLLQVRHRRCEPVHTRP